MHCKTDFATSWSFSRNKANNKTLLQSKLCHTVAVLKVYLGKRPLGLKAVLEPKISVTLH